MDRIGAGDGIRTRDQELGKLLLYQLSYARLSAATIVSQPYHDRRSLEMWNTWAAARAAMPIAA
jgi:hypothetical protein